LGEPLKRSVGWLSVSNERKLMWWRILLEVVIAIVLLAIGSSFWSILKSRGHLQALLTDKNELKRLLSHWSAPEIVREGREIKPVFGSYLENIRFFERAHFAALNKTRNLILIVVAGLLVLSYLMGLPYLIASLAVFILPSFSQIGASAKNHNATHVHTVVLNVYKWNQTAPDECSHYCEDHADLKQVYRLLNELTQGASQHALGADSPVSSLYS
jgi:hypothetical protein